MLSSRCLCGRISTENEPDCCTKLFNLFSKRDYLKNKDSFWFYVVFLERFSCTAVSANINSF